MKKMALLLFVVVLLSSLTFLSCKSKKPDLSEIDAETADQIMHGTYKEKSNPIGNILTFLVLGTIGIVVARNAKKNKMNPWFWGILAFIFNILALPSFFTHRWLNRGKLISNTIFEKRRVKILQSSLILTAISILFLFLSTLEDKNTQEEKQARSNILLIGIVIGIPSAISAIITYTNKQNELASNISYSSTNSNAQLSNNERLHFCQSCGKHILNENAQFCASCGAKL